MEVGRGFATVRISYIHGKCIETQMIWRHSELDLKHPVGRCERGLKRWRCRCRLGRRTSSAAPCCQQDDQQSQAKKRAADLRHWADTDHPRLLLLCAVI